MSGVPVPLVKVTKAPTTGLPAVVKAVPDKLAEHVPEFIAPTLTVAVAGLKALVVFPATADPVAST